MPLIRRSAESTRHGWRTSSRGDAAVAHAGAVHVLCREAADRIRQRYPQRPRMEAIGNAAIAAAVVRRLQRRHRQRARTVRCPAVAELPIPGAMRVRQHHPPRGMLTTKVGGCCRPATHDMVVAIGHGRSGNRPRLAVRGSGSRVPVHATVRVRAG